MRNLIIFAVGLVLGFGISQTFSKKEILQTSNDEKISALDQISKTDYQDYLRIKDADEKLKKADEILGKVMVLFLADLSLHIGQQKTIPVSASKVENVAKPETMDSSAAVKTAPAVMESAHPLTALPTKVFNDKKITQSATMKEALSYLKEVEVKDLKSVLSEVSKVTSEQNLLLQGHYVGVVTFDDNTEPWRIEWDVNSEFRDGQLKGQSEIRLSNSKKVFSRSGGQGDIKDFSAWAKDSQAILVNSYGDDGYIQLYYLSHLNKFVGNYYLKDKSGSFRKTGTTFLEKMN